MKRIWIALCIIAGIFTGVLTGVIPAARHIQQEEMEREYLKELKAQMIPSDSEHLERQLDLAKWYNWNLKAAAPEPGFEQAYSQILNYQEGVMALLILPGEVLPIYHQGNSGTISGAEHCFGTSLPIGGRGNCCVLQLPETMDPAELPQGDPAVVFCLGRSLFYREIQEDSAEEGMDLLILAAPGGEEKRIFSRSEAITIATADPPVPPGVLRDALKATALFVLLLFTGFCCAARSKLGRRNRNYRKIQGKSNISR